MVIYQVVVIETRRYVIDSRTAESVPRLPRPSIRKLLTNQQAGYKNAPQKSDIATAPAWLRSEATAGG